MVLTVLLWMTALGWLIVVVTSAVGIMRMRDLPPDVAGQEPPAVSVVIAARNEAHQIETTARRILAQEGIDLEVIVVNDRSTDGTGAILDRLGDADPRLHVVHVDHLPEGWVGKCHALHAGTAEARGKWILFTDADIGMTPLVIARAVHAAESEQADHVCLMPRQRDATLLGKASMLMLLIGMPDAFRKASRDKVGPGFGAFNLVRADALREIGGYAALRMEVLDDHLLGQLLHRAGKRTRGYFAGRDVEMDLARTPGGLVRAIEKNGFAIIRYDTLVAVAITLIWGSLLASVVAGPITGGMAGWAATVSFLCLTVPGVMLARRYAWPAPAGILAPLGLLVVAVAAANSVVKTLGRRGVRWRGDFYALDALRRGRARVRSRTTPRPGA
jgi:hypothetical protein